MQLEGRTAIVTGAASGIGRAIALGLAQKGANIVIADINGEGGERVSQEIRTLGAQALAIQMDVAFGDQVQRTVEETLRQFDAIDILVNDAGIVAISPVTEMDEEEWDRVLDVNLKGIFLCCRAVLQHMIPRRQGKIVNVASTRGVHGARNESHYAASKAGIIAFTRSLAQEVARYNINVNAIAPGLTDTPFWRTHTRPEEIEAVYRAGRIGKPEDMVGAVLFLVSEASAPITGQTLFRDISMTEVTA